MALDFGHIRAEIEGATPAALRAGAEHVGEVSAAQCPVNEGTLVRSQKIDVDGDTASIRYTAPYAIYVHEILRNRHPHGNAKFLEIPMRSEKQKALDIIAETIKRAL